MGFRLVPKVVTLSDLESRNGRYFARVSDLLSQFSRKTDPPHLFAIRVVHHCAAI